MEKIELGLNYKKLDKDLQIISVITLIVLGVYILFQREIRGIIHNEEINVLLRAVLAGSFQFGIAGLGITVVSLLRKEKFASYGLKREKAFLAVMISVLCYIPHIIFLFVTNQIDRYLPFQSVWTTQYVLGSGFPTNVLGMFIIATAWGFFEGFNYVVICEKINKRYPSKNKWINYGAILCAIMCILIHGAVGVTLEGIIEMVTVFIIIYGMLMTKEFTDNAWGCVFIFIFLWNAF